MNDMHNNTCAQIPDTYSWVTDERSECSNNQQTRDVYCTKNGSYSADESGCIANAGPKPDTTQQANCGTGDPVCNLELGPQVDPERDTLCLVGDPRNRRLKDTGGGGSQWDCIVSGRDVQCSNYLYYKIVVVDSSREFSDTECDDNGSSGGCQGGNFPIGGSTYYFACPLTSGGWEDDPYYGALCYPLGSSINIVVNAGQANIQDFESIQELPYSPMPRSQLGNPIARQADRVYVTETETLIKMYNY